MATKQSIAIREEQAISAIIHAAKQLGGEFEMPQPIRDSYENEVARLEAIAAFMSGIVTTATEEAPKRAKKA